MNNVQISVEKGDISLHGVCVGHSPFSYQIKSCKNSSISRSLKSQYSSWGMQKALNINNPVVIAKQFYMVFT